MGRQVMVGLVMLGAVSPAACNSGEDSSAIAAGSQCDAMLHSVERNLLDDALVRETFGKATVDQRIEKIEQGCVASPRRDLAVANTLAAGNRTTDALSYLEARSYPEASWERIRLLQLYQGYFEARDRDKMLQVVHQLDKNHAASPEHRMVSGIETCLMGRCDQAVADLEYASEKTRNLLSFRYLMIAYFGASRFNDALAILDAGMFDNGAINEHMLYAAVSVYLVSHRRADAKAVFDKYIATHTSRPLDPSNPQDLVAQSWLMLELNK